MVTLFHRGLAVLVGVSVAVSACATAGGSRIAPMSAGSQGAMNRNVLVEYVQKLPPGTVVRVVRARQHSIRGTLMKATDQSLFIQPKTRVAEPIAEVPINEVVSVTPEREGGNGLGRAIGAGAAAGAAATVAIFLIIVAAFD